MQFRNLLSLWGALMILVFSNQLIGQTYSAVPYSDNFNSGLGTEWTTSSTEVQGVIETRDESGGWPQFGTTTDSYGNPTGGNGLAFYNSAATTPEDTLSALLHLNLAGATSVEMKFSLVDWGTGCSGSADKMFVYLSNDGGSTYGAVSTTVFLNLVPHNDGIWNNVTVDIDAIAAANSMTYSATSIIKFSVNLKCIGNPGTPKMGATQTIYMDGFGISAVSACPDTAITQPGDVCVGETEDLALHEAGDAGSWSITGTPGGSNPAVMTGDVFDASASNTDAGTYEVTFTVDAPVGGCPSTATRNIEVNALPVVDLGNDTSICIGANLTLDAGAGYSYAWTPGLEISQTINVSTANTYGVTITDGNGCDGTDALILTIDTLPTVNLGNDTSICSGESITLDAGAGYTYAWTLGLEISQTINVSTANTYGVTITDGNGCDGTDALILTIDTLPTVDLGNDTSICSGASLTLDAGAGYTYAWTPGLEISQTINVSTANTFGVTITDGNGCDGTDALILTIDTLPTVDLGNDTSICSGASLTLDAGAGYTYAWTPGLEISQTINVSTANTYGVTITDGNGCDGTDALILTIDTLPTVDLGNDTSICSGASLTLDAGAGYTYAWTPGLEISQTINVSTANTYGVTITDGNGCDGTDALILTIDTLPVVDLGNDTSICMGESLALNAGAGYTYAWTPGAEITQSIWVSTANTYGVTITDGNGCDGTDALTLTIDTLPVVDLGNDTSICSGEALLLDAGITWSSYLWGGGDITQWIIVNTASIYVVDVTDGNGCVGSGTITVSIDTLPVVDLGNDTSICNGASLTLDAGAGYTYAWTPGLEVSQTINVNTANTYGITITDGNGCDGTDALILTVDTLPVVNLGNDTSICNGASLTLDAGAGYTYAWTPGLEVSQTINVSTANTYGVTITDGNGCDGTDALILTIDTLPVVDLGNDTSICNIASITFDAGAGYTYAWTPGLEITQTINVNTANTYGVTITDGNGCISSDAVVLAVTSSPSLNLGVDTAICTNDSITLDAGAGYTYAWTPNNEITQAISVKSAGVFGVVITDGAGCSGSDSITVSLDTLPLISLGGDTAICADKSITFDAGAGYSYAWSPGGEISQTIVKNTADTFSVRIEDGNGCFGFDTVALLIDTLPVVDLGNDTSICMGDSIVFDAGVGYTYLWGPDGETSDTIKVKVANSYTVEVTDAKGCKGRDTIVLTLDTLPIVDLGNDTSICADKNIMFDAGAGYSYNWITLSGLATQTIVVDSAWTYGVVVTDGNGCVGYDQVSLSIDTLPIVDLGVDTSICVDSILVLDAGSGSSWLWNTLDISQVISVNSTGQFDVTVVDGNGCVGKDTIQVSINALPVVDLGNDTSICADSLIIMDASNVSSSWLWNTGATSQTLSINNSGQYDVIVTDTNGCVGYDTLVLSIDTLPIVDLGNDTSICVDSMLVLDAGNIGADNFLWSTGSLAGSISVNSTNNYNVAVTTTKGCVGYDTIDVVINQLPVIDLGPDSSLCQGDSMILYAGISAVSYFWNPSLETVDSLVVNSAGNYDLIVTDTNGCVGYDTINVTIDVLPVVDLGVDSSLCYGDSMLLFSGNAGSNILWSTGEVSNSISVDTADKYFVTVTNIALCSSSDSVVVTVDSLPVIDLGPDTTICVGDTLVLDGGIVGVDYRWSTGEITKMITIKDAKFFDVEVVDGNNCAATDTFGLKLYQLPVVNLGGSKEICDGDSLLLDAQNYSASFLWTPSNQITQTLLVDTAGIYQVIVTDTNSCVDSSSFTLLVNELPKVDIGIDTTICAENDFVLDPGKVGVNYEWNNGLTTQSIITKGAGVYWVRVEDAKLCFDTAVVTIDTFASPLVYLNAVDSSICAGDSMIMDAGTWANYQWSTGVFNQTIVVYSANTYSIIVTDGNGCLGYDTATVTVDKLPNVDLGPDVPVCKYLSIDLSVDEEFASYSWYPTLETTQVISTNKVGLYYIDVVDTNKCMKSDTINVVPGVDLIVDLGDSTVICDGTDIDLSPAISNEIGNVSYLWSTSEVSDEITVSAQNLYNVLVIDENGCWGVDSIYIEVHGLPTVQLVPDTLSICSIEEANEEFDISTVLAGLDIDYIEWGTGHVGNTLHVEQSGFYEATIYDEYGCTGYDSVTIAEYCRPIDITLPNIFTPNQDGVNDAFVPLELSWEDKDYMMANLKYINFSVYNRWGQLMFVSTEILPRWYGFNGRGAECPEGVYFWIVDYEDIDGKVSQDNGYVKLKR